MKNKIFYLPKFQNSGKLPKSTERLAVRDNTRTQLNPENNFVPRTTEVRPDKNILKNLGETILDFTPIIGDIKGLTIDPYRAYKENGWSGALKMAGLGLIGLVPVIGDVAKKSGKIIRSSKKATSWRDKAIYLRHSDLKDDWSNFNEKELQKHVSIKPTEKVKDQYLSKTYQGQYTTSPEEQFVRVNNTSQDRIKWIEEHSVKELPNYTTLEEQIKSADRTWANEYLEQFKKALNENVEYFVDPNKMRKGEVASSEGNILRGLWGNKPQGEIKTVFSKEDKTPFAETTLGHETAIHASGNLDDEYIYQYLKENDIVDFDNVSPYFKDADRGEIGAHLSEVPSYLGFKKETPTSKYQTPEGKSKINRYDIENYLQFQKENGVNIEHSILNNIKDWPKFLEFINGHKFAIIPFVGGSTIGLKTLNTNENNTNRN